MTTNHQCFSSLGAFNLETSTEDGTIGELTDGLCVGFVVGSALAISERSNSFFAIAWASFFISADDTVSGSVSIFKLFNALQSNLPSPEGFCRRSGVFDLDDLGSLRTH
eukprot:CAMPEP_0170183812 /NCGR_PEP_ID=MMETSP0040_2-20121228/31789_1 /TAXON_ID=641309 /ORGANISM="Lotharella oceanica, Strain CCMP622" /LENGTH=108 /DNA_ID=CAMNT_0010429663 /DNA_START=78 /DNA_END=404 /DNA_ORIENTATION=+